MNALTNSVSAVLSNSAKMENTDAENRNTQTKQKRKIRRQSPICCKSRSVLEVEWSC